MIRIMKYGEISDREVFARISPTANVEDAVAKIIMITAAGQKEKMMQAIKYGASEFLAKPYEAEEVVALIDKVLG